ncbi:helix-turn-helix domain-containing protein, partial [Salmonella enterica]|nr:helix-turn-helix domain-containing protein [Salmonella enterica]
FKKIMGIPVGKYIQLRRITRAAILLRFTNLTIADISERLFFDSQQTFTREFKKNTGFTPLQYRKSQLWSFKNMLGYRKANYNIPAPSIRLLKRKEFNGALVSFTTTLPSNTPLATLKWSAVDLYLPDDNKPLYISHKLENNKKDNGKILFNAVLWDQESKYKFSGELAEGLYAYFSFTGSKDDYIIFNYNIYMNTLPFYGLQKKDSYDLEIIRKINQETYHFEYFLPVICDEKTIKDIDCDYK